jgi:hypothetical protein
MHDQNRMVYFGSPINGGNADAFFNLLALAVHFIKPKRQTGRLVTIIAGKQLYPKARSANPASGIDSRAKQKPKA